MPQNESDLINSVSTILRAAFLAFRAVPRKVFQDFEGIEKADGTMQSLMDTLAQIMVRDFLRKHYSNDYFVGEEQIKDENLNHLETLFTGVPALKLRFGKYLNNERFQRANAEIPTFPESGSVWVCDPVDGTSNFKKRQDLSKPEDKSYQMYGFSLARLKINENNTADPDFGIAYAPEYEEATLVTNPNGELATKQLFAPMLVYQARNTERKINLFETKTTDWKIHWDEVNNDLVLQFPPTDTLDYVANLTEADFVRSTNRVVLRRSKSVGPNPYRGPFEQLLDNVEAEFEDKWDSSVVGLMEVVLGNAGVYGGIMQLWDHAALSAMIKQMGGTIYRIDLDTRTIQVFDDYSIEDVRKADKEKSTKLPLIVAFGEDNVTVLGQMPNEVQQFVYARDNGENLNKRIITCKGNTLKLWDENGQNLVIGAPLVGNVEELRASCTQQFVYAICETQIAVWEPNENGDLVYLTISDAAGNVLGPLPQEILLSGIQ